MTSAMFMKSFHYCCMFLRTVWSQQLCCQLFAWGTRAPSRGSAGWGVHGAEQAVTLCGLVYFFFFFFPPRGAVLISVVLSACQPSGRSVGSCRGARRDAALPKWLLGNVWACNSLFSWCYGRVVDQQPLVALRMGGSRFDGGAVILLTLPEH